MAPDGLRGKDLKPFLNLPRSPAGSYLRRAVALSSKGSHYPLAAFLGRELLTWIFEYAGNRLGPKHPFPAYEQGIDRGIYPLGDDAVIGGSPDPQGEVRVAVAGDWGSGTDEAAEVAQQMMRFGPHYTIHLGDVYYVGDGAEMRENCLGMPDPRHSFRPGRWPLGSVGAFALNGNHEMYALGYGYFDVFLPALGMRPLPGGAPAGQGASFFCQRNDHWIIVGLDTGYNSIGIPGLEIFRQPDSRLPGPLVAWVREHVRPLIGGRGVILLSHHQYYSVFDVSFPVPAAQLAEVFDRPVLWLWGHEHRMAIYGKHRVGRGLEAYGRCLGHGGMPVLLNAPAEPAKWPMVLYDNRPYPSDEHIPVAYNGFANLTLSGNRLTIDHRDLTGARVVTEVWETNGGVLIGKEIRASAEPGLVYDPDRLSLAIS
jgi:hypothetical protein